MALSALEWTCLPVRSTDPREGSASRLRSDQRADADPSALKSPVAETGLQIFARRNRSALAMTDTELRLIAPAAIIGLIRMPVNG